MTEDDVERIATIIDPRPFQRPARYIPEGDGYRRRTALQKARAIILEIEAMQKRDQQ